MNMPNYYQSSITSKPLMDDAQLGGIKSMFGQRQTAMPYQQMPGMANMLGGKAQQAIGGNLNQQYGAANQGAGINFDRNYALANTGNLFSTEQARANSGLRGGQYMANDDAIGQQGDLNQLQMQQAMMRMLMPYMG